jgi:hypothetical protein
LRRGHFQWLKKEQVNLHEYLYRHLTQSRLPQRLLVEQLNQHCYLLRHLLPKLLKYFGFQTQHCLCQPRRQ